MSSNTTGFAYLDSLSDEDRKLALTNTRKFWESLTVEQRTKHYAAYYEAIREKRKSNPLLMHRGVSDEEIMRGILNVYLPRVLQEAIEECEQNGRFDIAEDLRRRRLGVDTLEIKLYDEDTGKEVP